jgi:exodeoxyribonuclease V alpha subunit
MVRLTEIFRQASISKIITNAHIIKQGQLPQSYSSQALSYFYCLYAESPEEILANLMYIVLEHITQRFNLEPVNDVRVFTPMNRGGLVGCPLPQY